MQIKSTANRSGLYPIFWVLGIIGLILAWLYFIEYPSRVITKNNSELTPENILQFAGEEHTFEEVLDFFQDYTIFLSVKEDAALKMPDSIKTLLQNKGSKKIQNLGPWDAYVAKIDEGKFIKEKLRGKSAAQLSSRTFELSSAGVQTGNYCRLTWNGFLIESEYKGLNVFVCHPNYRDIFHFVFDFSTQENPLSADVLGKRQLVGVETIEIKLSEKQFDKIQKKRKEALKTEVLLTSDDDFVKANIIHENKEHPAEIRLKGDWIDHLTDDKWSFRVKLNDTVLKGMRKFSLHHPKTRNYAGEWYFHKLLTKYDILNLQYHFVQVVLAVEGKVPKPLGLYALEEGFDKNLVERNKKREGVIIKFDENPIWQERAYFIKNKIDLPKLDYFTHSDYPQLNILPFGETKVRKDSTLSRQFQTAKELLTAYVREEKTIAEVFDLELLANYNAICNLLGADHALLPHNFRFYYNPISSKLEPIGFDGNAFKQVVTFPVFYKAEEDLAYMRAYARALEVITAPQSMAEWQYDAALTAQVELLQKEFPEYELKFSVLRHNASLLKHEIFPQKCLNIFLEEYQEGSMVLTIENFGRFPVEILGLQNEDAKPMKVLQTPLIINRGERQTYTIALDEDYQKLFVSKKQKKAKFDLIKDIDKVFLQWRTLGTGPIRTASIVPWSERSPLTKENDLFRRKPNAHKFEFLHIDEARKTISCKKGAWTLKETLIIPPGYIFKAGPGCRIDLINYFSRIISFSPVQFIGTEQQAFELLSSTGKGEGILVMETQDTSYLEYCHFTNLSNPSTKTWAITGAVTFYAAPVKIQNCDFTSNRSEDALNIIHAKFEIKNTLFAQTQADAFDGDFVEGTIHNSHFIELGNDAIDISGSDIEVVDVTINEAGDKGLSAGESSMLRAYNIKVLNSEIGVASKDNSTLIVDILTLDNNKVGFTAFQKKLEFGPSFIEAMNVQFNKNELEYLIEEKSSLLFNGQTAETSTQVMERLYGTEFGKSSR